MIQLQSYDRGVVWPLAMRFRSTVLVCCLALLWACTPAPPETPRAVSAKSEKIARFYARMQDRQIARGLLRQDGGGPDTVFTQSQLLQNFRDIAFQDEYSAGLGLTPASPGAAPAVALRKWTNPVRITVEYGPSVPQKTRAAMDGETVAYAARLHRITNHPIGVTRFMGNFHILLTSADDRDFLSARLAQLAPGLSRKTQEQLLDLPLDIRCLVMGFGERKTGYRQAVAIIRAEHTDLMRRACLHEELAQGLGLVNDSPRARPSIFNDDDEFALLTTHDEYLLKLLYDPRLRPGMHQAEALPILRDRLSQIMPDG